jgi:hypothetical protein
MQPADHVHFGNPAGERFPDRLDDFIGGMFESMGITLFCRESAELAGEDADIGVIDVAIEDIGGDVAVLPFPHRAGHDAEGVKIARAIKGERLLLVDALVGSIFSAIG